MPVMASLAYTRGFKKQLRVQTSYLKESKKVQKTAQAKIAMIPTLKNYGEDA